MDTQPIGEAIARYPLDAFLQRDDGWILTASGVRFDLFAPTVDMIRIEDIAHALSQVNRFGGHTRFPYSVAQHSVLVSRHVPPSDALTGLMHDATEAYVGDVVRPLKRRLPDYVAIEDRLWQVIRLRFDLGPITPAIKVADERALQTERRDAMPASAHLWADDERRALPFEEKLEWIEPWRARQQFLDRFRALSLDL